jgi:hypothetical protein
VEHLLPVSAHCVPWPENRVAQVNRWAGGGRTRDAFSGLAMIPLGQKIEAIEGIVPARHSLVGRCAATGLMQQRIADLAISVLGCCELDSQKQAQLKVGAFQPQPSGYKN